MIPIVNSGFHAGVIDGGANHQNSAGYYVWDSVYFHDPEPSYGPDREYGAGSWQSYMCPDSAACTQVISPSASSTWQDDYNNYGSDTVVAGGGRDVDVQYAMAE